MRLTTLQTGLIIAGVLLVAGVLVYNWWQERRVRRRIEGAFRPQADPADVRDELLALRSVLGGSGD